MNPWPPAPKGLSQNEREIAQAKFAEVIAGATYELEHGGRVLGSEVDAGKWGNLVIEAYDAVAVPALELVNDDAALWPDGTESVLVKRELLDALRDALAV